MESKQQEQEEFRTLTVSDGPCADSEASDLILSANSSPCQISLKPQKKQCAESDYFPVNFIHDEVYALISAWQACDKLQRDATLEAQIAIDDKGSAVNSSVEPAVSKISDFDPQRNLAERIVAENLEPPKKFQRGRSHRAQGSQK